MSYYFCNMQNGSVNNSGEPTKVDTTASAACTQSGAFALLLTVTLSLLIPYWMERRNEVALGRYVSYRGNLANQIEALDDNPIWQKYKASNKAAESMSIAELMEISIKEPKTVSEAKTQPKSPPVTKNSAQHSEPRGQDFRDLQQGLL